jgi:hypothetical protein
LASRQAGSGAAGVNLRQEKVLEKNNKELLIVVKSSQAREQAQQGRRQPRNKIKVLSPASL